MAEIKYFGSDNNGSFVRPLNFRFPAGLNSIPASVSASFLVVAGGGAGGDNAGGGGGAGGFRTGNNTLSTANTYTITVGAGGALGVSPLLGANGSNSVISGTDITTICCGRRSC